MAMKIGTPIFVILLATASLFGESTSNVRSDARKLRDLVRRSPYFDYLLTGTTKRYGSAYDEGQPASLSDAAGAAQAGGEATLPAGWGRKLEGNPVRNTNVIVVGDTATVTCVADVDATLYVDRSLDGIKNPGAKPIADTVTRYSTWIKQNGKWRLREVSVAQVNLRDVGRQTVHVTEVKVTVNGQPVLDVTDPTLKYDVDAGLVHVKNGDAVTIEAAVTNTSDTGWVPQTYLYCHPNRPEGGRDLMYDDGTHGDLVPGDGTWTYQYSVNLQSGPHHAAIDALDSQCLQNEMDDDYNSAAWGMPYIVDP